MRYISITVPANKSKRRLAEGRDYNLRGWPYHDPAIPRQSTPKDGILSMNNAKAFARATVMMAVAAVYQRMEFYAKRFRARMDAAHGK